MQGVPYLRLLGLVVALTVVTSVIMLIPDWNGEQASTAAPKIDQLLDVAIILSSFVFSVVMVMLGYSIHRWRARPGDESDGAPLHGNTRLEIAWTAIPTAIVLILAAYSWIVLDDMEATASNAMPVEVTGQQYAWSFEYPDENIQADELHVVKDRQVAVEMRALDVLHSFWVPEWRVKRDAVPGAPGSGIDDDFVVTPDRAGTFTLVCTELCGLGHATMRAPVVVHETQAEFDRWAAEQEPIPPEQPQPAAASSA
ncbi:MAG: cytochrome c oxidase, subunit [Solirubrobacterales bacterium]|jgi:cytochrome c oxidase subunit 2|nr:cytochrome c oxidase, subunit [Solirubrobacterales bacterium]